jgi:hypothetical protein
MKIRYGFVSNSSSSSFVGIGWRVDLSDKSLINNIVKIMLKINDKNHILCEEYVKKLNNILKKDNIDLYNSGLEDIVYRFDMDLYIDGEGILENSYLIKCIDFSDISLNEMSEKFNTIVNNMLNNEFVKQLTDTLNNPYWINDEVER